MRDLLYQSPRSELEEKMLFDRLLDTIVSVYFLAHHADKLISKKETGEMFTTIGQENQELSEILSAGLSYRQEVLPDTEETERGAQQTTGSGRLTPFDLSCHSPCR